MAGNISAQPADEEVIRTQRTNSNRAIANHDTALLGLYWLEDLLVVTSRSVILHGKIVNQKAFEEEFQKKEKLLYVRTSKKIEVFSAWNMASEYGQWSGTWLLNGSPINISGSYYAKWHKVDGTWKIKFEMYTPSACEGGDYCKSYNFPNQSTAIVVQNFYYPKPGNEDEVITWRKRASAIRSKLGLPAGRILKRTSEATSQPYILWECEYPSLQAREDDVAQLELSEDFKNVQDHMSTLLEKFDRSLWQILQ
jgi:ketosteroid isomerase-like protein